MLAREFFEFDIVFLHFILVKNHLNKQILFTNLHFFVRIKLLFN